MPKRSSSMLPKQVKNLIPSEEMQVSVDGHSGGVGPRPWTITALLVLMVAGTVWGFIFGDGGLLSNLVGTVITALFMYGIWKGKSWVYLLLFALNALVFVTLIIVFVVIRPPGVVPAPVDGLVMSGLTLVLLMHPKTRRFAGTERSRREVPTEPTPKML